MPSESNYQSPFLEIWLKRIGLFCAILCFTIALSALLDLAFKWGFWANLAPKSAEMKPITAIALMISAIAVLTPRPLIMRLLGFLTCVLGCIVIFEYLTKEYFNIYLLLTVPTAGEILPAPETAICFVLSSIAIILKSISNKNLKVISELFAFISIAIALLALSGFLVEVDTKTTIFYPTLRAIGMALSTALAFILLNISIINLKISSETSLLASITLGGVMARRLIAVLTISPILIQLSINFFIELNIFEEAFRLPLSLIITYIIFMTFSWTVAKVTENIDKKNIFLTRKLEESDENYRTFIKSAADGIFIADIDGRYNYVNEAGCKLLGQSPDEIIGKTIIDLLPKEDIHKLEESKKQMLSSGGVHIAEWRLRRKDGSYVPVEVSAKILSDGRWQGMVRDISERKEVEQREKFQFELNKKLTESLITKERLEYAANLIIREYVDCCYISLPEKLQLNEIKVAKCRGNISFDFQIIDTIANDPLFLKTIQSRHEFLVSKDNFSDFYRAYTDKNITHPFSMIILPLIARTKILGMIFLLKGNENFSERDFEFLKVVVNSISILIDNTLLYENAQKASQTREDLMAIVSHDLKNPLSVISLSANLIERQTLKEELSSEILLQLIQRIKNAAKNSELLISDLLINAKIESGNFEVAKNPESPKEILYETIDFLTPLASQKNIQIVLKLPEFVPFFYVDKARIHQVLNNIIGNAIKFTPNNGSIKIEVHESERKDILFSIEDNGPGIDEESLPHIFDRYWQPERSKRQGTGLGLSIAKGIIEAHGGKIWVESILGKGTTFYFTIPEYKINSEFSSKNNLRNENRPLQ